MKIKRFHQLVRCEKGPVNTAVIDLLKGHIYHVANGFIEKFDSRKYDEIVEFVKSLEKEELIIEIEENAWIPVIDPGPNNGEEISFIIEMEEGVEPGLIKRLFKDFKVFKIHYYGQNTPGEIIPGVDILRKEKNFSRCIESSTREGELKKVNESIYRWNKKYHNCWGRKIAITKDMMVRPCIYSSIITGNLNENNIDKIMEKAGQYWTITKDKVERCKDCELRYICFDCREIAFRSMGNLFASNPNCTYDPHTGTWTLT